MRDGRWFAVMLVGMFACGGGGKKQVNEPTGDDTSTGDGDSGGGDVMVSPEKMDEINTRLDRRRNAVARCLTDAQIAGNAPKVAHGKMTVEFVVSPAGKAENIKIAKSTMDNGVVQNCVIQKVGETAFPELPKSLEWSYTFSFQSS
jgi:hypothetical protein